MDCGTWIGVLGIVIGISASSVFYLLSRRRPSLAYDVETVRLISKQESDLPDRVTIRFDRRPVDRLSRTHVRIWNMGNTTVRGGDVVTEDNLRITLEQAEFLAAQVVRATRKVNGFGVLTDAFPAKSVECQFDYLDPGDGVAIELVHTGEGEEPCVRGSVRGLPRGLTCAMRQPASGPVGILRMFLALVFLALSVTVVGVASRLDTTIHGSLTAQLARTRCAWESSSAIMDEYRALVTAREAEVRAERAMRVGSLEARSSASAALRRAMRLARDADVRAGEVIRHAGKVFEATEPRTHQTSSAAARERSAAKSLPLYAAAAATALLYGVWVCFAVQQVLAKRRRYPKDLIIGG